MSAAKENSILKLLNSDELNQARRNHLELIAMGIPTMGDLAKALGLSSGAPHRMQDRLVDEYGPEMYLSFYNSRREAAILLRQLDFTWQKIADLLDYGKASIVYKDVSDYLGGSLRFLMDYEVLTPNEFSELQKKIRNR